MLSFLRRNSSTLDTGAAERNAPPLQLLVIASDKDKAEWATLMNGLSVEDGRSIEVTQCGWDDIMCAAEPKSSVPIVVHLRKSKLHPKRPTTLRPDFALIRNEVSVPGKDYRNQMFGLMFAGVQSVNSFSSIYSFCEKAVVQAELFNISRRCGMDANGDEIFPVMPQQYFASFQEMMYTQAFPAVVKIGSAHAGMGKMMINDHHQMEDFRTCLAMTKGSGDSTSAYCCAEEFVEGDYDLRIQKIGEHYRCFKRISVSGAWKTNTGSSRLEHIELTPKYKRWADEAAQMFGGLDILTVDAIHESSTGREYILEVNGTSSGLAPDTSEEDNIHIRDLVIEKMNASFCRQGGAALPAPQTNLDGAAAASNNSSREGEVAQPGVPAGDAEAQPLAADAPSPKTSPAAAVATAEE